MSQKRTSRILAAGFALASFPAVVVLTGCSSGLSGDAGVSAASSPSLPAISSSLRGAAHGGQFPITDGIIQMYAVGSSGNGSPSTSLLTATVTTSDGTGVANSNANAGNGYNAFPAGQFTVSGLYTCPSGNPSALTYIVATHGNPGMTGSVNNTSIALIAALGACNTLATNFPFISLDEVTTVASTYALAPFMVDTAHIGAAATNSTGIANAFLMANTLANVGTGTSPSLNLPSTSTVPVTEIYTLADIIASCINSSGVDGTCSGLISSTTAGGVTPVDTATAVLGIVKSPTNNAGALWSNYVNAQSPFQPNLSAAPSDWSVAVKTTGAGLSAPTGIAIDASGNAWIANSGGTSITELSSTGSVLSGTGGFSGGGLLGPQALAIDTAGNVWIANSYAGTVVEMSSTGAITASGITTGGITSPFAIAVDMSNNVWVANLNESTVSAFNGSTALSGSPFSASGNINLPSGLAVDSSSNIWVSNNGGNTVTQLSNAGANLSGAGYTDGYILAPSGVAITTTGNAFVAATGINAVSVFGSTGTPAASSPVSALSTPSGVATDGANAVWITNSQTSGSLAYLASATATPVALGSLNTPVGVAVDASGNVWTANSGDNSVSEFVGLASAVTTPLVNQF